MGLTSGVNIRLSLDGLPAKAGIHLRPAAAGQMYARFRENDVSVGRYARDKGMAAKQPAVYLMASGEQTTLYGGVTGNLELRVWEHREGLVEGFIRRYGVK